VLRPYLTKYNSEALMSQYVLILQNYVITLILKKTFGPSWQLYDVVK